MPGLIYEISHFLLSMAIGIVMALASLPESVPPGSVQLVAGIAFLIIGSGMVCLTWEERKHVP